MVCSLDMYLYLYSCVPFKSCTDNPYIMPFLFVLDMAPLYAKLMFPCPIKDKSLICREALKKINANSNFISSANLRIVNLKKLTLQHNYMKELPEL